MHCSYIKILRQQVHSQRRQLYQTLRRHIQKCLNSSGLGCISVQILCAQKSNFWFHLGSRLKMSKIVKYFISGICLFSLYRDIFIGFWPEVEVPTLISSAPRFFSKVPRLDPLTFLKRITVTLQAPYVLYIRTGVSLLSRERFLYN